jgi:hypothetical protein
MVNADEVINLAIDPCQNVARAGKLANLDGGPRNAADRDEEKNHRDQSKLVAIHGRSVSCVHGEP